MAKLGSLHDIRGIPANLGIQTLKFEKLYCKKRRAHYADSSFAAQFEDSYAGTLTGQISTSRAVVHKQLVQCPLFQKH